MISISFDSDTACHEHIQLELQFAIPKVKDEMSTASCQCHFATCVPNQAATANQLKIIHHHKLMDCD